MTLLWQESVRWLYLVINPLDGSDSRSWVTSVIKTDCEAAFIYFSCFRIMADCGGASTDERSGSQQLHPLAALGGKAHEGTEFHLEGATRTHTTLKLLNVVVNNCRVMDVFGFGFHHNSELSQEVKSIGSVFTFS